MKLVNINQKKETLSRLPAPPTYLNTIAKKHFRKIGKKLIEIDLLKNIHLPALEIMADNYAQWEWAVKKINAKNKKKPGTGYIQTYKTGAENISVELVIKRDAEKAILQSFKAFGLDPKSEKDLKTVVDPAQTNLFEEFKNLKSS